MATADLLFDVSTFRYPEYLGGLFQLTEETTIRRFILSFESMNNNTKLTREQLQECWFHALHREYRKLLSNTAHMTQEQTEVAEKLLSRGIEQVGTQTLITYFEHPTNNLND
jgi:acyl-[acyl carrier protein]--UDP-N-acetylglucosamine O-acyltransferase